MSFEYTYDEMISGHGAEMILCSSLIQIPKDKGNKDKLVLIFVYYLIQTAYRSCHLFCEVELLSGRLAVEQDKD